MSLHISLDQQIAELVDRAVRQALTEVLPLAKGDPAGVARIHEAVEMFAGCYPDVPVSVDPASELSAIFGNERAQLVVTGVMVPGPSSRPLVAHARMPVVLVNLAA